MNKAARSKFGLAYLNASFYALVSASILLTGCVYDPLYYGPPPYSQYQPSYYDYYFYPSARVYFQFTTGYYYYRVKDRWVRARVLPPDVHIDARDRVRIREDSDKPYLRLPEHERSYKPNPNYRWDRDRSIREREANQQWFREYEQRQGKPGTKPKEDKDRQDKLRPDRY